MSAHTPGPWEHFATAVHAENGREIIFNRHNTRSGTPIERVANARLIAAAPEMLEALQQLVRGHDGQRKDGDRPITLARAAIAKATWGDK